MVCLSYGRDQIRIVGSSTVLPYAQIVAERFHESFPEFKTPIVESGGSGAGIKEFCKGEGLNTVDIVNASRPLLESETKACEQSGVRDIEKIMFGYDGMVFAVASDSSDFSVTFQDIYKALAEKIVVKGKLVVNPNLFWSDVNPILPRKEIKILLPGLKHGTRDALDKSLMLVGCKDSQLMEFAAKEGLGPHALENICTTVRKDGKTIDIDGDNAEALVRLFSEKDVVGVFSLSFYENNRDRLKALKVNDVLPSVETITNGTYPLSRPLFFYVKKAHFNLVPGLQDYVRFFLEEEIVGADGILAQYGLSPVVAQQSHPL